MQHFKASSSINVHRSELKLCGKNRPAGFPPSVIFKLIIKALHLRGVNVKVRPEKSPLWKIKSLYQLNRISTAPHKLDLIVKHTHTRTNKGSENNTFPGDPLRLFLTSATTTSSGFALHRFWPRTLVVNVIAQSDVRCPQASRAKRII